MRRRTIARPVTIEGAGLHEGRPAKLALLAAPAGAGIYFRRTDLPGSGPVPALVTAREERPRRTALARGAVEVHTVEHLLAAVSGSGITDLEIAIDEVEVPGLDGSALPFLQAILAAGTRELEGLAPRLVLDRTIEVEEKGARIVAAPCPGRLAIEYILDYPDVRRSRIALEVDETSFARELAPARTFCLEREALALRAAGLGRGATSENTLVVGTDGLPLGNRLRFPDEYARHKALDLFGDLALVGARLEARVFAYRSGHALNARLARRLRDLVEEAFHAAPSPFRARASGSVGGDRPLVPRGGGALEPAPIAFEGHFPNFPVLPGVVSLAAIAEAAGGRIVAIEGARFRRLVRPGDRLHVAVEGAEGGRVRGAVRIASGGVPAVAAEASVEIAPEGP